LPEATNNRNHTRRDPPTDSTVRYVTSYQAIGGHDNVITQGNWPSNDCPWPKPHPVAQRRNVSISSPSCQARSAEGYPVTYVTIAADGNGTYNYTTEVIYEKSWSDMSVRIYFNAK
jgi:hypothetical protein